MPEIAWPRRKIRIDRVTRAGATANTFTVPDASDRASIGFYDEVLINGGNKVYIQPGDRGDEYGISETEYHGGFRTLPTDNILEKDVGVIVNYPSRPLLRDHGAVVNTSVFNPLRTNPYTLSEAIYEGSISLDVHDANDVPIVEAFIDQLASSDAWFECPLPGNTLRGATVYAYDNIKEIDDPDYVDDPNDSNDRAPKIENPHYREIELRGPDRNKNLVGAFARVGPRTCRVVSDRVTSAGNHIIRIAPPLISDLATNFSAVDTCRVRPRDNNAISSTGTADFEASWIIHWIETLGLN